MRLVKNKDGYIIKCQDIENGIVKSNDYYCSRCNKTAIFVSSSHRNSSYFRHKNEELDDCYNYNKFNNDYFESNIMSEFHKNWQEIFPNENIEYKIEKKIKNIFADIYISNNTAFDICNIFETSKPTLIIEIQNSAISNETLKERNDFYIDDNTNLLWIFNIKDKCVIEKIVLFNETIIRIRLFGKHYFTELFKINEKPIVLLDNGGLFLYLVINKPDYDIDFIEVKKISRNIFLQELSNIINKEIKNISDTTNNKIKVYDYENSIINIKNTSNENKDKLRYIFYMLEKIPFKFFNTSFEDLLIFKEWYCNDCCFWNYLNNKNCYKCKNSKPFSIDDLIGILSIISNKSDIIRELFIRFIEKNKKEIKTIINFGKYKNEKLIDLPINYLEWLLENKNDKYCKCNKTKNGDICSNCKLYEDIEFIIMYSIERIRRFFNSIFDHGEMMYFDYTIIDFVKNYNKENNKQLLLQIKNKLGNEDCKKYNYVYK